ncbi:MAG: SDR family oxidoreductase [Candidatus Gracilibacteria bacterium]|nr:SDR family oxidoreductase [Candidatus Gracilibacteria bacterium]
MKKILVTGGAGFVGSHLCRRLLNEGNEVICLDNLFTGTKENIEDMLQNSNFNFILHDVNLPFWGQFDQIYNLACPASPIHYQRNPIETFKTSILGAMNMLELALKTKARILQASTSEVYGDPVVHPQNEGYWGNVNPIGIRSCYDEGKRGSETLFMDYHREHGVDIRIVRIFNTYGSLMHPADGRVVSNFIMQALKNEDITIYGDGTQTRSFQYIDDLVDVMIRMMNNEIGFIGPVNTGTQFEFTIKELAEIVLKLIPESKSKLVYKPLPGDDPKQRKADNKLAFEKLGRQPLIPLEKGLIPTIEYFRKFI